MTSTTYGKVGAYASQQRDTEDVRTTDARALLSCASRLKTAIDDGGKDMKAYGDAVRHNQRLWTIFQIAVSDPANPLPDHLKVLLLNLARYVDRVSFRAITGFLPPLLTELIEINRSIATGLSATPKNQVPQPETAHIPVTPGAVMTTSA